jgi:hypothetical protein|tara:strand:- start:272 stop:475 length:204 start_codon:yes stop_codon:yes gene_type:complete
MTNKYKWIIRFKNYFSMGGKDYYTMKLPLSTKDEKTAKKIIIKNMDKYFGSDSPSWGVEEMKLENSS